TALSSSIIPCTTHSRSAARNVVRLTQEGVPWYFRSEPRALPGDGVDRAVLEEALGTPDAGPVAVAPGAARTDSALAALLLFDVPDGGVAGAALADTALAADQIGRASVGKVWRVGWSERDGSTSTGL